MPISARFDTGEHFNSPVSKVVCVGRNYAEHAAELNNPVPAEPLLFIKPSTSVVSMEQTIVLPKQRGPVHYELEVALLIGRTLAHADAAEVLPAIAGVGLALDLTLRELQSALKEKGHPWEKAKAFDGACPLSRFVRPERLPMLTQMSFSLSLNGEMRQNGNTRDMLVPLVPLVAYISSYFTLEPGDIVLTGTPKGVGLLEPGMEIVASLDSVLQLHSRVESVPIG